MFGRSNCDVVCPRGRLDEGVCGIAAASGSMLQDLPHWEIGFKMIWQDASLAMHVRHLL